MDKIKRPEVLQGVTKKVKAGCGSVFVTVNSLGGLTKKEKEILSMLKKWHNNAKRIKHFNGILGR